jgi:hypothetical protein
MDCVAGPWPAGQLVVGTALHSQVLSKLVLETCWTPPSPIKILPAPAGLPAEFIFIDRAIGPAIGRAMSLPPPFAGEFTRAERTATRAPLKAVHDTETMWLFTPNPPDWRWLA